MTKTEMVINGITGHLCAVYDKYVTPVLFRMCFGRTNFLFYEVDGTMFSEGWLVCPIETEEIIALEHGSIDVRSVLNMHRETARIIYHHFKDNRYTDDTGVWNIADDTVWYKHLLPNTDNWKLNKQNIEYYFDSTQNPG